MARSTATRDWAFLARQAHTLKGLAGTLGAAQLAEVAVRLEQAAKAGDVAQADKASARLATDSRRVVALLDRVA